MRLELCRNTDGTGFVVCINGDRSRKQIAVPLSHDLSDRIEVMLKEEGIGSSLLLPSLGRN